MITDSLAELHTALPPGWEVTFQPDGALSPEGLETAQRVVEIANPGLAIDVPGPAPRQIPASLRLYFYPIAHKDHILEVIATTSDSSGCIPIRFAESLEWYVVTTPCDLTGGVNTDSAIQLRAPIIKAVRAFLAGQ
jgi:hypothetical protein